MRNEFTAIIEPPEENEGWFVAYCSEIPESNGQGRTKEEALASLADSIALALEIRRDEALQDVSPSAVRETVVVE